MPVKISSAAPAKGWNSPLAMVGLLALILGLLFYRSFIPQEVVFSNDGPLGGLVAEQNQLPQTFTGLWADLNSAGSSVGTATPAISSLLRWITGPVGYAKFFAPVALFIVGLGAWTFFRTLKLAPLAATLGALAAMLNSTFFATACWGVASQQIALGMDFFALALIVANTKETPWLIRWTRFALAGLCVGINVMEAADIGALFSLFIAAFVLFKSLADGAGNVWANAVRGVSRMAVVAGFAGFIAIQTVFSLVTTQIQGVAGTAQDSETKAANWDKATQWSLPKTETLGLFVPGLFGYKLDTPNNMMSQFADAYRGGAYWGGVGRDPANDRYFDNGGQGSPPNPNWMRQIGGGDYCGILVSLIAAWAVAQLFRRQNSPFAPAQKKMIWFWAAVLFVSLLFAWGRFASFYALLYQMPYVSTFRNPAKFVIFLSWALVILFGYGVHALSGRHLNGVAAKSFGLMTQLKNWWAKTGDFDRRWTFACGGIFGASVLGWLIYAAQKPALIRYLQKVGFPDADPAHEMSAPAIAAFSLGQTGWWLLLFAAAIALLALVMAGCFSGPRAKLGGLLLGGFLVLDLGRADLPYIIHWDYKQKYEVGSLNPIVNFLRDKPYEHRVAGLPFEPQQQLRGYDNTFGGLGIYRIEWMQHHFPYYNIQCLDIVQMPRMPEDLKAYLEALWPHTQADAALYARHWELTNTRYLLGAAGFLDVLNQQLDPLQHRFRIAQRFDVVSKPGITQPTRLEELTAMPASDGDLALFEFTGALPRAKLYANWQVNTNDQAVLKNLADLNFDPAKTVLVSTPAAPLAAGSTNENSGTVEFKSYAPKKIGFATSAAAPAVLLLNDKYDPNWRVTVDGQPAELLRCNFLMRGVYVPAGPHTVEFKFSLPNKPLYVTLAAIGTGILLLGLLIFLGRREAAETASSTSGSGRR